jgi:pimeloyl-ACP methyl ester carboxylesterase
MGEFSSFDGTTLYFEEAGIGGTPVLLLHGLSSSTRGNWQEPGIWQALIEAGKQVFAMDARGHGRSDKPYEPSAYEDHAMVKDVGAFMDHLGLEEIDLVGYSMGAVTALGFATSDQRLRRLVLGGIGGDPAKWGPDVEGRATIARRWLAGLEAADPDAIEDPVAKRARKVFEARGNDLRAIAALLRSNRKHLSADTRLDKVLVPTLVVCGDRDLSPHPLAAALPNAKAVVIAGDHIEAVGNPELARAIVDFVSD